MESFYKVHVKMSRNLSFQIHAKNSTYSRPVYNQMADAESKHRISRGMALHKVYSSVAIVYHIYHIHHFGKRIREALQTLELRNVGFIRTYQTGKQITYICTSLKAAQ